MRRLPLLLTLALLLLSALPAGAARVTLLPGEEPYTLELLAATPERSVVELQLNYFDLEALSIDGAPYAQVALGKRALHLERGLPALPTLRESLLIPDDGVMVLRVLGVETREFTGVDVAPSKGNLPRTVDPALVAYTFADFYKTDAWYPEQSARLETPYILRDTRGLVLELNPFQVNPATHTLRVATRLTVEVTLAGPGGENALSVKPAHRVRDFEQLYARHYLNYAAAGDRYTSIDEVGSMLVISYDAFASAVEPFVAWKNQLGIPTTLVNVSAIGSTGTQIKAYIQNLYNTTGVAFIALVGDATQVPYYNNGGASDPSYAFLAGSDNYPDAFVGRLSAETLAQVETQVTRSVEYERDAQAAAWYPKGTGIASAQGAGIGDDGEADYVHMDVIRAKLLGFTYNEVDQIYDTNGGTAAMVSAALNAGRSVVDYCGHGSMTSWGTTGFSNTHVAALTNDNKLPFIHSVACNVGEFQSGTCFAEAWLRASHNGEPTGAIGFYGSTISQSWAPPMCAQDETIDLLVGNEKRCWGSLCFNGACQMNDEYGADGENETKFWTVFGDPSLRVRTASPQAVSAVHIGLIDPLLPSFTVATEPGNRVALSNAGSFVGAAFADAAGQAVVPIVGALPDPGEFATLTVSGFNRITHVEDVLVAVLHAGTLAGAVTNASNGGTPVVGATVRVVETGQSFLSQAGGAYSGPVQEGTYSIRAQHPSFATVTVSGVGIVEDQTTTLDFSLVDILGPSFTGTTVLPNTDDTTGPYLVQTQLGDYSAISSQRCFYRVSGGTPVEIPLETVNPLTGICEAEIPGQPVNAEVRYWLEATDIAGNSSRDPADAQSDYSFWVLNSLLVADEDMEAGTGWTVGGAGDDATSGLWTRVDPIGVWNAGVEVQPEDDASPDGTLCFITGNAETGTQGADDVDGGQTTLLSPVYDLSDATAVTLSYRRWYTNDTGNNPGSDIWLVQVTSDGTNWVNLESTSGSAREWRLMSFLLDDYIELTSTVRVRFVASDEGSGSLVEAGVDEVMLSGFADPTATAAGEGPIAALALFQNTPNPFNPKTTIRFALPAPSAVRLAIYDVQGRLVRELLAGRTLPAGAHAADWDGRDNAGRALGSGVFFYRLEAAGEVLNGKMLLLK